MGRAGCFLTAGAVILSAALLTAERVQTWAVGPVVLSPGESGSFDSIAVKDPSIVYHGNAWHLFYTARNRTEYTLGYVSSAQLEGLAKAPRRLLGELHAANSKYAAAPQVFYFRPHRKWYLIYQTTDSNYLPVYSTTNRIEDAESWTPAKPLVNKTDKGKWIDFWIICDETTAYLFFTRDQRDVMVMTTSLHDFPSGFANMQTALTRVHEAAHVYSVPGTKPGYIMLFEQQEGQLRRFGLAHARSLAGPWAVTQEDFASGRNLTYAAGQARWTDEVSHGELLRSGYDERLEVPANRRRFLIQGLPRDQHTGDYPLLPWRLGLITASAGTKP